MRILFVCSAGEFPEIGSGHFARVYTIIGYLVKEFTKKHKIEIDGSKCAMSKMEIKIKIQKFKNSKSKFTPPLSQTIVNHLFRSEQLNVIKKNV